MLSDTNSSVEILQKKLEVVQLLNSCTYVILLEFKKKKKQEFISEPDNLLSDFKIKSQE